MQPTHMEQIKTSFRNASPIDIRRYHCPTRAKIRTVFEDRHRSDIKSILSVTNETSINVDDESKLPIGVIFFRDGKQYAMGVCKRLGVYSIDDEFTINVAQVISFNLWGPYQRVGWTCGEIRRLLAWRKRTMDKPCRIYMQLVEQFEKSRWMLFCFWPGKLEDLIEMELQLMDNVMEQDDLICGNMRTRIPKLYGLQSVDELKKMVREQYEKTTFSLNETEIQFIRNRARFGKQIEQIYKN